MEPWFGLSAKVRPLLTSAAAAALVSVALRIWPELVLGGFARGAAKLAGWWLGLPAVRDELGWRLATAGQPTVVTAACSATDFCLLITAVLGWHLGRSRRLPSLLGVSLAVIFAAPVAIIVNALRIIAVVQTHTWVIPLFPATYGPFLHLLTGVAVFLPALIGCNVLLERHGFR